MRTLLISTLLALAATPVLAQSYEHAISQAPAYDRDAGHGDRGDRRDDGYGRDDRAPRGGYQDQGAYGQYDRPPPPRRRPAPAPVSRYAGFGNPVYYDDGMIRTGRDYPAGTVGLAYGPQGRPQVCTVRRSYYDADQGRYRVVRRRVPCAGQGRYEEE
ncbi:MAG: hypothetical protein V4597_08750 [Pseudomonadota bacterium]